MITENRNPRSYGLHKMNSMQIVRLMNDEEHLVVRALYAAESQIAAAAEKVAEAYLNGGRIIYVGAGASGRMATLDAADMIPTFGVESGKVVAVLAGGIPSLYQPVEGVEDDEYQAILDINALNITQKDVLIGLSASGRTPYVLSAIRHASRKGLWTCGVTNNKHTTLADLADHLIFLDTGPEILTGSTRLKAATSQKLCLNQLNTVAMVLCGKVIENFMVDIVPVNEKLKERCVRIVRELTTATDEESRELLEQFGWHVRDVLAHMGVTAAPQIFKHAQG